MGRGGELRANTPPLPDCYVTHQYIALADFTSLVSQPLRTCLHCTEPRLPLLLSLPRCAAAPHGEHDVLNLPHIRHTVTFSQRLAGLDQSQAATSFQWDGSGRPQTMTYPATPE